MPVKRSDGKFAARKNVFRAAFSFFFLNNKNGEEGILGTDLKSKLLFHTHTLAHRDTRTQSQSVADTKLQPNDSTNLLFINQFYYREKEEKNYNNKNVSL